jgi:hypothetical protein
MVVSIGHVQPAAPPRGAARGEATAPDMASASADPISAPMQPGEAPEDYVCRVIAATITAPPDADAALASRVRTLFHPAYEQHSDGQTFGRDRFTSLLRSQRAKLAAPPAVSWSALIATEPHDGTVHVTSVHDVAMELRDGTRLLKQVFALIRIDLATGTIVHCDEVSRMQSVMPCDRAAPLGQLPMRRVHPHAHRVDLYAVDYWVADGPAGAPAADPTSPVQLAKHHRQVGSYDSTMTAFEAELAAEAVRDASGEIDASDGL